MFLAFHISGSGINNMSEKWLAVHKLRYLQQVLTLIYSDAIFKRHIINQSTFYFAVQHNYWISYNIAY